MQLVPLDRIRIDGPTQTRARLDPEAVKEYGDAYGRGERLPDVIAFDDGDAVCLADGFHRAAGARKAGKTEINADLRKGTQRDALLFSAGCNSTHGVRRASEDKRYAVSAVLADTEWAGRSDLWIADVCRVSNHLVAKVRAELQAGRNSP